MRVVGLPSDRRAPQTPLRIALHLSGRFPSIAAPITATLGVTARLATNDSVDALFAWSSYALASEIARRTRVVVVRGSTHIRTQRALLADAPRSGRPSRLTQRLEEAEYRLGDAVTVPTQEIADDPQWARQRVTPAVTPYGFPSTADASSTARTATARDGLRVVFGGAAGYRKGVDRLASALRTRPSSVASFELFGDATDEDPNSFPAWWTIRGHQPRSTWLEALGQAHVLLLPSREEGMARVGQEAMAMGVPVIATPESGLGMWLEKGGGLVLPHENWSSSLDSLITNMRDSWLGFQHSRDRNRERVDLA